MPTVAPSFDVDDGVRLHVLGHLERELEIGQLLLASG